MVRIHRQDALAGINRRTNVIAAVTHPDLDRGAIGARCQAPASTAQGAALHHGGRCIADADAWFIIHNLDRQTTAAGIAISVRRHHRRVIKQRLAAVIGLSQQGVGVIHYPITKAGYRQLVTQPGRHQQRIGCAGPLQTG